MPKFSKREALAAGWQIFKSNWKFLVAITIISLVISYLPTAVSSVWSQQYPIQTAIFSIIFWVISLVISVGLIKISLNLVDGQAANFDDLYSHWKLTWRFFLVQAIVSFIIGSSVLILLGTVVLAFGMGGDFFLNGAFRWYTPILFLIAIVIAGADLIFLIQSIARLSIVTYFVVDKNFGPIAAMKESWRLTRGSVGNLFLFGILIGLIYLLGILVFGIGLLAAIPVTGLAMAAVYRKLAATP